MNSNPKDAEDRLPGGRGEAADGRPAEQVTAAALRFEDIIHLAPDAVIAIGGDMRIQVFNESAEQMFGYAAAEVLGRPLDILIPPRFRNAHRLHVEMFRRAPDVRRRMDGRSEITALRKDGSEFPATASVSKLQVAGDTIFTVMLVDVTLRKRAEEAVRVACDAAEAANKAKSQFLAAMSHDLRTPLNSILGFADIIDHARVGPLAGKYQEYARDIKRSGEHLLSLVEQILDLSTIESGRASLSRERIGVGEIMDDCVRLIADAAERHGLRLTKVPPPRAAHVVADRRALTQVLLNLLSNAIAYTPPGGRITFSAAANDHEIRFQVTDTGCGIPAGDLTRILEPFQRGEQDPYKASRGWGLGLAIAKSLVELHGGSLDVSSNPGAGTTVTVSLPGDN